MSLFYKGREVLDIPPNWDNLSDNSFKDYKIEPISSGVSTGWDTRQQPRRQAKVSWLLCSKKEIDCFQAFVERHKARGYAFWLPLWDMVQPIVQNNIAGTLPSFAFNIIAFEGFNLMDLYGTYPDQFKNFCAIKTGEIVPFEISNYTINASGNESVRTSYNPNLFLNFQDQSICPLILCRFASDEFKYFYVSNEAAVIHNRFSELPKEYTATSSVNRVSYAYTFTNVNGTFRYVDYPRPVTIGGNTYEPSNIVHERIQRNENFLDEQVRIQVGVDYTAHPLRAFINPQTNYRTYLTVEYLTVDHSNDTATATTEFTGEVDEIGYDPEGNISLTCSTTFKRGRTGIVPNFTLQKKCNWRLYSTNCGLNSATYQTTTTVTSATATSIVYGALANTTLEATNWLTYGTVTYNNESRTITKHDSGASAIYINAPFSTTPSATDTITVLPGCAKTNAACVNKFNNVANFGGFPLLPKRPSWIEALSPPEQKPNKK